MLIIGSLLLIPIGLIMVLSPKMFYEITESWKSHSSIDPSDGYILITRISGVVFLLVGILSLITFFITS